MRADPHSVSDGGLAYEKPQSGLRSFVRADFSPISPALVFAVQSPSTLRMSQICLQRMAVENSHKCLFL
jgi:hypothetical protein